MRAQHGQEFIGPAGHVECVRELEGVLDINIVVREAVNEQERTLQLGRVGEHAARAVAFGVFLGQTHITFGVIGVVIFPGDNRCPGDPGLKHIGPAKGGHGGKISTKRPARHPHPGEIHFGILRSEGLQALDLVVQGEVDQVAADHPLPGATAQRRAPAIESGNDKTLVGHPLVGEIGAQAGGDHGGVGPRVSRENDGVFFSGLKISRPHEGGVIGTLAAGRPGEFDPGPAGWILGERRQLGQFPAICREHLAAGRAVEETEGVQHHLAVFAELRTMRAAGGSQGGPGAAGERCFPHLRLGGIDTGAQVNQAGFLVGRDDAAVAKPRRRELAHQSAGGLAELHLPVTATLARPKELLAALQPVRELCAFIEIEPGRVGFAQQHARGAGDRIGREQTLLLLGAILNQQAERGACFLPYDPGEVGEMRDIPVDPTGRAAGAGDDAEAYFGVGRAGPRIIKLQRRGFGVERIADVAGLNLRLIRLLIGQPLRIRRPPVAREPGHLLLRHKFGGPMRKGGGGPGRKRVVGVGGQIDDVDFTALHGGHIRAVR